MKDLERIRLEVWLEAAIEELNFAAENASGEVMKNYLAKRAAFFANKLKNSKEQP